MVFSRVASSRWFRRPFSSPLPFALAWALVGLSACEDDEGDSDSLSTSTTGLTTSSQSTWTSSSSTSGSSDGSMSSDTSTSSGVERPDGWFPDSHDEAGPARLDKVLPDGKVNELHVEMAPEVWAAMQADIDAILQPGGAACEGKKDRDPCQDPTLPNGAGVCVDFMGQMQCIPDVFTPCLGKEENDACDVPWGGVGLCMTGVIGDDLVCLPPDDMGGDSCAAAQPGDACANARGQIGTCEAADDESEALSCEAPDDAIPTYEDPCRGLQAGEACQVGLTGKGQCVDVMGRQHCEIAGFDGADLSGVPIDYVAKFFATDPGSFPCTVRFEDRVWTQVAMRYKGNNSLASSPGIKRPFALTFDHFEDTVPAIANQRFWGFRRLSFHNGITDPSLLHQRAAAEIFAAAAVPAPKTAFYAIYLNVGEGEKLLGMYTATEFPDKPFLDRTFGSHDGNLYKPDGRGAHFAEYIEESFHPKNNEDALDFSDAKAFVAALHAPQSDRAAWRSGLAQSFDIDGFAKFFAVNTAMDNWDTYGGFAHNFYLYNDPSIDALRWIAWDFDLALSYVAQPATLSLLNYSGEWPLLQALARDPVYADRYHQNLRAALTHAFDKTSNSARWESWHQLLAPYVKQEFGDTKAFDEGVAQVQTHLLDQWTAVDTYLKSRGY